MKYVLALCLSVVAFPMLGAQPDAPVPDADSQEAKLVALTNAWTGAINTKDRSKLDALMASDFTLHAWDESWNVDRAQWLKNLLEGYDIAEYHHSAIVARIYGDTGTVTSKWYWRGTLKKKPFEEHGYVLDVWRRNSGHWQVVSRITIIQQGKE
jgi:ketosteroid isomerase-like protein